MKKKPERVPAAASERRNTVTMSLDDDSLRMLDELTHRLQQVSGTSRKVTRSAAMREAIICLHSRALSSADGSRFELHAPKKPKPGKPATTNGKKV